MCGIVGLRRFDRQPIDHGILDRMTDTLTHRGPDDRGVLCLSELGLGHRRLAVIDLNTGSQPMQREDLGRTVVFNGEIYNYLELRQELIALGHHFVTQSDTEVILVAHAAWGVEMLRKLRGMFAFALWEDAGKTLFLARDPFGKKPLCYTYRPEKYFAFASEAKALLEMPELDRRINPTAIWAFCELMYVPEQLHVWADIERVQPGQALLVTDNGIHTWQYTPLSDDTSRVFTSFEDACQAIKTELAEAIRIRLRSDVPVGLFLSGGIDSTIVAFIAAELISQPLETYTVGFQVSRPDEFVDERVFGREVARRIGAHHNEIHVDLHAIDLIQEIAYYFDEPFGDTSALPMLAMARETKKHVTVVLSGDGGDEIFGGYPTYLRHLVINESLPIDRPVSRFLAQLKDQVRSLPPWISGAIARIARPFREQIDSFTDAVEQDTALRHLLMMRVNHAIFPATYLQPLLGNRGNLDLRNFVRDVPEQQSPLRTAMLCDAAVLLPGQILKKVDISTMASGLEVRSPLLDDRIAAITRRLPLEFLIHADPQHPKSYWGKRLLKSLCVPYMGEQFTYRTKSGFLLPLQQWLDEASFRELIYDGVGSHDSPTSEWFAPGTARKIYEDFRAGKRWLAQEVWNLIILDAWARRYRPSN